MVAMEEEAPPATTVARPFNVGDIGDVLEEVCTGLFMVVGVSCPVFAPPSNPQTQYSC